MVVPPCKVRIRFPISLSDIHYPQMVGVQTFILKHVIRRTPEHLRGSYRIDFCSLICRRNGKSVEPGPGQVLSFTFMVRVYQVIPPTTGHRAEISRCLSL